MPPKPIKPTQSFSDKRTYIPPRVQQALDRNAGQPIPPPAPPPAPLYPPDQPQSVTPPTGPSKEYDFIFNPEKPPKRPWLPGRNSSLPVRALMAAGGLLVLIIIFVIVKNLLGGGNSTYMAFTGVVQDQQELIHLATNAGLQTNITTGNKNFAATAQLSLTSSQAALGKYLALNGHKVSAKTLDLKLSTSLDNQLTNAATAATYDQTFKQIMKTKLTEYMDDLSRTYKQTKGKNGRALLNNDYDQAQLLLTQLDAPAN